MNSTPAPGERVAFTISRAMDFFTEKDLAAQTGHKSRQWPLVVLKELADNALDACEEAGIAPRIDVTVDSGSITVADNGPGIPPEVIDGVLDYSSRVSSREAYAAPDRGAQGNALKTLMAMPLVLDGTAGRVTVTARGVRHDIEIRVDPLRQAPGISHQQAPSDVRTGTQITVHWPGSACLLNPRGGEWAVFADSLRLRVAEPAPDDGRGLGQRRRDAQRPVRGQ